MEDKSVNAGASQADFELFVHIERTLYTAVVADAMDELGYHDRAMSEFLRPLTPKSCFAGWARTIAWRLAISRDAGSPLPQTSPRQTAHRLESSRIKSK